MDLWNFDFWTDFLDVQRRDCVLCSEERLCPVFRGMNVSCVQRSDGYRVMKDKIPANRSDGYMVMKDKIPGPGRARARR